MPAYKYSNYDNTAQQLENLPKKPKYRAVPIRKSNNNIKKSPKNRTLALNFALLTFGGIITLVFVVIYSFVAVSETKLTNLHTSISDLNYENTELENKLENVKSYYSVDTKVASTATFDKAKSVIEVDKVDAKTTSEKNSAINGNLHTVTGF